MSAAGQPPGSGVVRVKNKAPAAIQITAEQLLREAWDNKEVSGAAAAPPRHQIADEEELAEYQQTKRKSFEDRIVMSRGNMTLWLRYARWEEAQRDFTRARSVFERAIDTDYRSHTVWLAYAEMEMRHKFINHARNVWDRAVTILPRVSQLWLKYAFMEEMLSNFPLARLVYTRWMQWHPDVSAFLAFVRFEERHGSADDARAVYEQLLAAHPTVRAFLKYASFEERGKHVSAARAIYERAAECPAFRPNAELYIAFARFEERAGELERARGIYTYASKQSLSAEEMSLVLDAMATFEKQRGEQAGLEAVVLSRKRTEYERRIAEDPRDYDVWFDLIRLEESIGETSRVRDTYKRAVQHTPPPSSKRFWRRYIYLWLGYAVWEEIEAGDLERAAEVYEACLASIPEAHRNFSFAKVWVLAAKLEVRRKNLDAARRLLGEALGVLPQKESLYRDYIAIERAVGEIGRVRTLFKAWLESNPTSSAAFIEFANMEAEDLQEISRARNIYELGVKSAHLDDPEMLWNAYIEFEASCGETERAIALYERLLGRGSHITVWLAYAKFCEGLSENRVSESRVRHVYSRGDADLKRRVRDAGHGSSNREIAAGDRVRLLDAWISWERSIAIDTSINDKNVQEVQARMPKRIKRRRPMTDARGEVSGWEEYFEFVFPEDEQANPKLKILEAARKWKMQKQMASGQSL